MSIPNSLKVYKLNPIYAYIWVPNLEFDERTSKEVTGQIMAHQKHNKDIREKRRIANTERAI
jgi:hypothetical protein